MVRGVWWDRDNAKNKALLSGAPAPARRSWPARITFSGRPAPPPPAPGAPPPGPLSPGGRARAGPPGGGAPPHLEHFFVGSTCFARIAAFHALAHFERRLLCRLREELRRAPALPATTVPGAF